MTPRYGHRPDQCDCFGGYCYKAIGCRSKGGGFETVRSRRTTERPPREAHVILAWRDDGSHERGSIPLGRIPEEYLYLFSED